MKKSMKTHLTCPNCGANDAYTEFESGRGYCHSEAKNIFTKEYRGMTEPEIKGFTFEGIRGLDRDVAEMYGICVHLDEKKQPVRYAFKYPSNTKYRDTVPAGTKGKRFWWKEKGSNKDLFGPNFNAGSSKRIYLTEGEFDAASLYQILGKTYPVKSLPSSSISDEFISSAYEYLSTFQEIVYCGEQDKAGKACAERLYKAFPSKFYFVPMTKHKDANDFLTSGDGDDLKWAAIKPIRWTPDNFFCSDQAVVRAIREESPYEYTPTGHSGLDSKIKGLVKGGLTFLKAPPGSGKTEFFRYLSTNILRSTETKVALLFMEEMKSLTYRAMATYELGINVRTRDDAKDNSVSEEKVEEAAVKATKGERTIVFEMRGDDDPLEVVNYCRIATGVYGAEYVFIDHVQRLAYLSGVDGATSVLTSLAAKLAQLSKELNVGIIMISHVNDEGHTKYAKSLEEEAAVCIRIERDKEATDTEERNTTRFYIEKNRPFSKLGFAGAVLYDEETTILTEVHV
jgi:twinkle protein